MNINELKLFIGIFTLSLSFNTHSNEKLPEGKRIFNQILIISDTIDQNISTGKCVIFGKVYFETETEPTVSEFVLCNNKNSAYYKNDRNKFKKINSDGSFEIKIDTSIQYLKFKNKLGDKEFSLLEDIYFENYKFKSQHKIEIAVYLPLKSKQYNLIIDKPVIYAYSDKPIDFSIHLKEKGELTFTYPQLQNEHLWKVKTGENGNLISENDVTFPYLFWEAKQDFSSEIGYHSNSNEIIYTKDLVTYFELELSKLGLNFKEQADFITYWCPKFIDAKNVQVQIFIDDNCSIIGDLVISPKPDHLRRIFVLFEANPIDLKNFIPKKLNVQTFERTGFTVIEWGGSEINNKLQ